MPAAPSRSAAARPLRALAGWGLVAAVALARAATGPFGASAQEQEGEDAGAFLREELYAVHCGGCHSVDGRGGVTAGGLTAPPLRPEDNPRMTVAYARLTMDTGRMPPAGDPADNRIRRVTLTEQQREDIVRFMVDRFGLEGDVPEPAHGDAAVGLQVYAQNCAACHGASGAGGVAGGGAWTPRVNDVSAQTLADAVRVGPFQMPRFDGEQITDAELGHMAAFLAEVEEEGGTLLFPGELNPVFASGFGAGLAAVIIVMLVLISGKPTMFPDPERDAEDAPTGPPRPPSTPPEEPSDAGFGDDAGPDRPEEEPS
jgi:ubiquinol-cytochrome c reductase cytochrome c subunit